MGSLRISLVAVAVGASVVLAGCGSQGTGTSAGADAANTTYRKPDATPVASGPAQARQSAPKITSGNRPSRPLSTPEAEKSLNGKPALNPCSLVTRAEARVIVGANIGAPSLAPQGPTCLYVAGKQSIALAVQDLQVPAQTKAGRSVIKMKVGGRAAYCVDDGGLRVLVPLESGKTLTVAGACPIAARFASKALPRLRR